MLNKKLSLTIVLIGLMLSLSACKTLVPKEYLVTKAKLMATLQSKFPIKHESVNGTLRFSLDSPQLSLDPQQNRISIAGQYIANVTLFELKGNFVFSTSLKYNPAKRSIYMSEARFDSITPSGNIIEEKVRGMINQEISELTTNQPLYTFKQDELVALGVRVDVSSVQIENDGVLLKLHKIK